MMLAYTFARWAKRGVWFYFTKSFRLNTRETLSIVRISLK